MRRHNPRDARDRNRFTIPQSYHDSCRRNGKLDPCILTDVVFWQWRESVCWHSACLSAAQEPTFRSGSRVVPSYVTVVDANNRLVTDLTRDDFEVLDNGRPQDITIFDNEVRPFTVVVMLDTSVSMTDRLEDLYAGAEQFLLRLMPHDKAMRRRVQRQGRVCVRLHQRPEQPRQRD